MGMDIWPPVRAGRHPCPALLEIPGHDSEAVAMATLWRWSMGLDPPAGGEENSKTEGAQGHTNSLA
eukprot:9482764-Pyramimonas_sp.AAC.1